MVTIVLGEYAAITSVLKMEE